jgi:hypothetical protein
MGNKTAGLLIIFIFSSAFAMGQMRFGIRGGINSSRIITEDVISTPDYKITFPSYAMVGYHMGVVGQYETFNFFVQPEILYTITRNDINVYNLHSGNQGDPNIAVQKLNRIDVPVILGYKFKIVKLMAGPLATFIISDGSELQDMTGYEIQFNTAVFGYQAGVGLDVGKLAVDVKYEGNFSKVSDGIIVNGNTLNYESNQSQFTLSVGLFF